MSGLRLTVSGATGLIGSALMVALGERGSELTALSRDPGSATEPLRGRGCDAAETVAWNPLAEACPAAALSGRDAVVHLAGESVAQRWSETAKRAIRDSRVIGTRNLVAGLREADPRPRALISGSAVGYYGPRGEEPLDEDAPPGEDFLAGVCVAWEREAEAARELGVRVVRVRTGIVLDRHGGALASMLTPFRLGLGGPIASGRQYISWIHLADEVGILLAALGDERFDGAVNATAPQPVHNRDFARALGRALRRPAFMPLPGFVLHARYGEMAGVLTSGARAVPAKALVNGYEFRHPHLPEALGAALAHR